MGKKKKKKTAKSIKNLDNKGGGKPKLGSSHRGLSDIFKKEKR